MMDEMMTTTDNTLRDAVMQVAKAKVAEALGGDVLGKMVDAVMMHRDTRNSRTEFELIVDRQILQAIESAVLNYMAENRDAIESAVQAAMREGADKFAATIVDAFSDGDWRANLEVKIKRPANYP